MLKAAIAVAPEASNSPKINMEINNIFFMVSGSFF
jgi:hypothetical protein